MAGNGDSTTRSRCGRRLVFRNDDVQHAERRRTRQVNRSPPRVLEIISPIRVTEGEIRLNLLNPGQKQGISSEGNPLALGTRRVSHKFV